MRQKLLIWCFYGNPFELLGELREWPEFVAGGEESLELRDRQTGERVTIDNLDVWDDGYLSIESPAAGALFDRVVGGVSRLLSARSGFLKLRRDPYDADLLHRPKFITRKNRPG